MNEFNLPTAPGAIIGYRRNGQPIHLIAGGNGEGDGGSGQASDGQDGTGTGNGDGGDPSGQPSGQDGGAGGTGGRSDGDPGTGGGTGSGQAGDSGDPAKVIAAIRGDFKAERERRQAAERELAAVKEAQAKLQQALDADKADRQSQMDALAKALGLKKDDEPPTPEKLAAQLADAQRAKEDEIKAREAAEARAADVLRQHQVERSVLRYAPQLDANGLALLDSRSFMETAGKLDPAAEDFADKLGEAIKTAVEANPAYKATQPKRATPPTSSSGGEFNGAPGGNRQWTDEDVAKASPAELRKALDAGLLASLGAGIPGRRAKRR